jgi:hypothetical protein
MATKITNMGVRFILKQANKLEIYGRIK